MCNLINTHTHTRTHTHQTHTHTLRRKKEHKTGAGTGTSGNGNKDSRGDGNGDRSENGDRTKPDRTGPEAGTEKRMESEDGEEESSGIRRIRKKRRLEFQTLFFRLWSHLCKQEVVLAGRQQLRAQGSVPVRRPSAEGRAGPREWVGGNGSKNGDENGEGVDGRESPGTCEVIAEVEVMRKT